jgi:hypothetical protein
MLLARLVEVSEDDLLGKGEVAPETPPDDLQVVPRAGVDVLDEFLRGFDLCRGLLLGRFKRA